MRAWPHARYRRFRHCRHSPGTVSGDANEDTTMEDASRTTTSRYAKVIEVSKRVRWEIERDVIRGRTFDLAFDFLPAGLSLVDELDFLSPEQKRALSHVQGRTYANIFALVERFIGAKMADLGRTHALGDQNAFEALVRFTDEELKHQALFRRIEEMLAAGMPAGYALAAEPNAVAAAVLSKSNWSVLALTCHIELFVQAHYRASIGPVETLSPLWKDVFLFHWREESQHAILDELEWRRENANLSAAERDGAVDDLIALVGAVDGLLQVQAAADADYFMAVGGRPFTLQQAARLGTGMLEAYRWQYIFSGVEDPRFMGILGDMVTPEQSARIAEALATIAQARS